MIRPPDDHGMPPRLPGLFITGTDTGVGKTAVAAAIVRLLVHQGRRVAALKPVATGATRDGDTWRCEDAEALVQALGGALPLARVSPWIHEPPLAPPVAARLAGEPLHWPRLRAVVREALAWWAEQGAEVVIVEGVGGFLCPLAEEATVADLAIDLDFPLVIVARRGLGTLNHTLLTVEAARMRGLRIAGVVLNGSEPTTNALAESTNPDELTRHLDGIPILAEIPHGVGTTHHGTLPDLHTELLGVDWWGRASVSRYAPELAATSGPGNGS